MLAAVATAAASGCAAPVAASRPPPVVFSQTLAGVRFRVRKESSAPEQEVAAALELELARAGLVVVTDDRLEADAEVKVRVESQELGPLGRGRVGVRVERGGTLIDGMWTSQEFFRSDRFAERVARQLAEWMARSPRVAWLNASPPPAAAAAVPHEDASSLAVEAEPAPQPAEPTVRKSGHFGWGFGLELQLGWNPVVTPGGSPEGFLFALAAQVDLGPRAALRLPLSIVVAASGENDYSELALTPTYIYRFRYRTHQELVPYAGLGVKLAFVDASRPLLGRPLNGMRTPDSCDRQTSVQRDCSFAISPAPTVGIEFSPSRLFTLDVAFSYSFSHLTSSEGAVSWVHLFAVSVGPRLSL
jgi:hypothetical protein